MPVPSSLISSAEQSIPLWYFDTNDGEWHEDGSAQLNPGGTEYKGTVTHFTTWNWDKDWTLASLTAVRGWVIDAATGQPVPNAQIFINGNNWASFDDGVGMEGYFQIPALPNRPATLYASKNKVKSKPIEIYTSSAGNSVDGGSRSRSASHWRGRHGRRLALLGCDGARRQSHEREGDQRLSP